MNKLIHNPDANLKKYVSFDLDSTLIKTKSERIYPIDENDWIWLYDCIPEILKKLHFEGFHIIIITNQSEKKVPVITTKLNNICKLLDITITSLICYEEPYRKPCMRSILENFNPKLIKFYCGDALGRPKDFANTDLLFGFNLNIPVTSPEEFFLQEKTLPYSIPPPLTLKHNPIQLKYVENHVIIMSGYPASGKSSFAKYLADNYKYLIISQDIFKTAAKTRKAFLQALGKNPIIIDNTSPDIHSRRFYIEKAQEKQLQIDSIYCTTPINIAYHLNYIRCEQSEQPKFISKIVYYTFRKKFQQPSTDEGFTELYQYTPNIDKTIFENFRYPIIE